MGDETEDTLAFRMDLIGATGTAVTAADLSVKGWGWWKRRMNGDIRITHPPSGQVVLNERVPISGTHNLVGNKKRQGYFWLLTRERVNYWPQREIDLKENGRWEETVNVGRDEGPRESVVILVHLSDFMHEISTDYKSRSKKGNYYGPLVMHPPKAHFSIVQGLVLVIPAKPPA